MPTTVQLFSLQANRRALQSRERLLPYIYTMHRQLFDVGVGIIQPMFVAPKLVLGLVPRLRTWVPRLKCQG